MLKKINRLNSAGDTIVEVMIVLAVLGLAISIAYATANRSLLNTRQAQENSEATQIAESQVEALSTLANDTTQNIYQAGPYCISDTAPYAVQTTNCDKQTQNNGVSYTVQITCDAACLSGSNPNHNIKTFVTWPDVKGEGNDTVTIYYRVHPT